MISNFSSHLQLVTIYILIPIKLEGDPSVAVAMYAAEYIEFNWITACTVFSAVTKVNKFDLISLLPGSLIVVIVETFKGEIILNQNL